MSVPQSALKAKLTDILNSLANSIGIGLGSSLPFKLVDDGVLNSPSFSLWSDPSRNGQGHLLLGGVNKAMYNEPLEAFPFNSSRANESPSLPLSAVVLKSSGDSQHSAATFTYDFSDSPPAFLSTVDNWTFLPNDTLHQIFADLDITPTPVWHGYVGYVDCARQTENRTISMIFGSVTVSVPWAELLQPAGNNTCELLIALFSPNITFGPGSQIQIGSVFLQHMYLAVDYDNAFAAVALLNPNPGPDQILEIGNGTRIPDADGKFPATITPYGATVPATTTSHLPTSTTSSAAAATFPPRAVDMTFGVSGAIFAVFYCII